MESKFIYFPEQIKTELVPRSYPKDVPPLNSIALDLLELSGNQEPSEELIEKIELYLEALLIET